MNISAYNLFFRFALFVLSFWCVEAQIIPVTISKEENILTWKEAVFHCWNEYRVRK